MKALLVQQGLLKILNMKNKLLESISKDENEELNIKTHCAIKLFLADEVLQKVVDETVACYGEG